MHKVNVRDIAQESWSSPKGKFGCKDIEISVALGRVPASMDLNERHPFDVEIMTVPAAKTAFPYHSHSAQWEFYHVIAGRGYVRHAGGTTPVEIGDAFVFKPGEAHTLVGGENDDLVVYLVADNPIGESAHYPDSNKYLVRSPERTVLRSESLEYLDGEE